MIPTKLARKVLSKADQEHLTSVAGVRSMVGFLRTRKYQIERREEDGIEPCFECKLIAKKLEVD